jgi:hypothetical protein
VLKRDVTAEAKRAEERAVNFKLQTSNGKPQTGKSFEEEEFG